MERSELCWVKQEDGTYKNPDADPNCKECKGIGIVDDGGFAIGVDIDCECIPKWTVDNEENEDDLSITLIVKYGEYIMRCYKITDDALTFACLLLNETEEQIAVRIRKRLLKNTKKALWVDKTIVICRQERRQ